MVLSVDNERNKMVATVQNGSRTEKYECVISACENPVCTCGTTYLDLIPIKLDDDNKEHSHQ